MFCKSKTKPKVSEKNGQPVRVSFEKKLLHTELVEFYEILRDKEDGIFFKL